MRNILISTVLVVGIFVGLLSTAGRSLHYVADAVIGGIHNAAGVFFVPSITVASLQSKYVIAANTSSKVRILIVPGHEPDFGGAEYRDLKERDMNVEVASALADLLSRNPHYEVIVARGKDDWNPIFKEYFEREADAIKEFSAVQKNEMKNLVRNGSIKKTQGVYHNSAPTEQALRLFGINKWINENRVDVALHIHFNDNPRKNYRGPGEYQGFVLYVPESQYSNAHATQTFADFMLKRLLKYFTKSTLPQEAEGVVEDQDLIAIGSNNTSNAASVLIEYGYIYESRFAHKEIRDMVFKDLALQTYLGIQDFFGGNDAVANRQYDTFALPYIWKAPFSGNGEFSPSVYAFQMAMMHEGLYPGEGKDSSECPLSGMLGPCTLGALKKFQDNNSLTDELGVLGKKTRALLNSRYGVQSI